MDCTSVVMLWGITTLIISIVMSVVMALMVMAMLVTLVAMPLMIMPCMVVPLMAMVMVMVLSTLSMEVIGIIPSSGQVSAAAHALGSRNAGAVVLICDHLDGGVLDAGLSQHRGGLMQDLRAVAARADVDVGGQQGHAGLQGPDVQVVHLHHTSNLQRDRGSVSHPVPQKSVC